MSRSVWSILTFVVVSFIINAVLMAEGAHAQVGAQPGPGTVAGVVRDSSDAPVPGASLRIVSEATGVAIESLSDERGAYRVTSLALGRYRVEAALDGFETAVRRVVLDSSQTAAVDVTLEPARLSEGIVVTARRVEEAAQEVPIPVSVLSGTLVADAGAFNVNRLKELVPTVQFYSSNPRNSSINIRGLGAPFGLTNDGIEPGVGLYIDGAFFSRPAAATLAPIAAFSQPCERTNPRSLAASKPRRSKSGFGAPI